MAFQFVPSGNAVKNQPIVWKFESHETVYQSQQERFERNVEFWRHKMGLPASERVVTLNGEFQPIEYTEFEEIEVVEPEYIEFEELKEEIKDEQPITNEPIDIASNSELDAQPSVPQDTEAPVNTPKRKPRKKATDL